MIRRTWVVVASLATAAACSPKTEDQVASAPAAPPLRLTVADSGLNTPESVLYDVIGDAYLVSNINGSPIEKDGNGFISRVSPDGRLTEPKWIAGGMNGVTLNAPKGMGIKGDTLFVTDIDVVRLFNRSTGAPIAARAVRGATFLNDLAVGPDGSVYVTDSGLKAGPNGFAETGTDAVYKFNAAGQAVAIAKGADMGRPNGLSVDSSGITVVSFGSGEVYRIDVSTGARTNLPKPPRGQLDGVERLADGSLLVSSWEGSAIYRFSNGSYTTAVDSVTTPADIGYDSKRMAVLIPIFTKNQIEIREVK